LKKIPGELAASEKKEICTMSVQRKNKEIMSYCCTWTKCWADSLVLRVRRPFMHSTGSARTETQVSGV